MQVSIPILNNEFLNGVLNIPLNLKSIINFAHGSGSSGSSPRNKYVANVIIDHGFAILLTDLLFQEQQDYKDIIKFINYRIYMHYK